MVFSTVFQLYRSGQCTYPCFPGVFIFSKPVLRTIFFPSHWLLSHITIVETADSGERGMNPVAMTIINPRKEYWPSRGLHQRPPVLKSAMLPTELRGSAETCEEKGESTGVSSFFFSPHCFESLSFPSGSYNLGIVWW